MRSGRRYLLASALLMVLLAGWAFLLWFPSPQEPGYRFVQAWGQRGAGPGEFEGPTGIALAATAVFVSDSGNNRIQVFDQEGRFLRQFGRDGDGVGELSRPMHLDIRDQRLYVAEFLNDRIQIFAFDGQPLGVVAGGRDGLAFDAPGGVAAASDRLYVADFYNHSVQVVGADGRFLQRYGLEATPGRSAGLFNYPTDVALLPNGDLVVADAYNHRVQVFTPQGEFLRKWGGPFAIGLPGAGNGWFRTATAVAIGPKGDLFVADFYNHRVQKFSKEGRFLASIGSEGSGPGQFDRPTDMAVDDQGHVYAVDFGHHRILKFEPLP